METAPYVSSSDADSEDEADADGISAGALAFFFDIGEDASGSDDDGDDAADAAVPPSPREGLSSSELPRLQVPGHRLDDLAKFVSDPASPFYTRFRHRAPVILTEFASRWRLFDSASRITASCSSSSASSSCCWRNAVRNALLCCAETPLSCLLALDEIHFFANALCDEIELPMATVVENILPGDTKAAVVGTSRRPMYARLRPIPPALQRIFNLRDGSSKNQWLGRDVFKHALCACWLGDAGTITPLHFDFCHGLLVVLTGCKKVTLFCPEDSMYLYRVSATNPNPNSSATHWEKFVASGLSAASSPSCSSSELSDCEEEQRAEEAAAAAKVATAAYRKKYSRLHEATPVEVMLTAGETLYIPPGWWHHVENLEPTVSVLLPFDMETSRENLHPMLLLR